MHKKNEDEDFDKEEENNLDEEADDLDFNDEEERDEEK